MSKKNKGANFPQNQREFIFQKKNYTIMFIGLGFIALGYILLILDGRSQLHARNAGPFYLRS